MAASALISIPDNTSVEGFLVLVYDDTEQVKDRSRIAGSG